MQGLLCACQAISRNHLNKMTTGMHAHAGQGPGKSRLVFPKPLSAVLGAGQSYTYGPAFLQFNGANWLNAQALLATVTAVSTAC